MPKLDKGNWNGKLLLKRENKYINMLYYKQCLEQFHNRAFEYWVRRNYKIPKVSMRIKLSVILIFLQYIIFPLEILVIYLIFKEMSYLMVVLK